ncbi:dimethyl sulfoxide reductase anchor subunit family protein [Piscinibacter koreensis]|uniref:Dimethyl sulfoxide reductase anchor subunit n=1 Tax=Piscinibacter koreensis TaxID=2742824 RepID=A0A7Y6TWE8_9BURK|nr:DmsC/YnfH family molybdoenzyme membrane anchor subunit [Schlegelella koreensis]NUZ06049.1 dimethyl sulfoxide reductase anchor subunit [Schlegelella koreensis]
MNPAWSVVSFTTLAGAAQGLVVALAVALLLGVDVAPAAAGPALVVALLLLVAGLAASFLHLGRPERAWRAAMMWRTSWLSREVIVLPAFIGLVALWWLALRAGSPPALTATLLPLLAIAGAGLLWTCTGMIYACLRFIEEWAHPLTLASFALSGLSSGLMLAAALGVLAGHEALARTAASVALVVTLLAWGARSLALRRNTALRHRSTLQSATGIRASRLVQTSMGMTGGSFNTREFFHRASVAAVRQVRLATHVLGFAAPAALLAAGLVGAWPSAFVIALVLQVPGLVADRWLFFAEAKHPQNLYYQVVS